MNSAAASSQTSRRNFGEPDARARVVIHAALKTDWPRLGSFWGRAIQPMLTLMGTCVFGCLWAAPAVEGGAFVFDLNDGLFMLNSPCLGLALRNLAAHAPPELQESIGVRKADPSKSRLDGVAKAGTSLETGMACLSLKGGCRWGKLSALRRPFIVCNISMAFTSISAATFCFFLGRRAHKIQQAMNWQPLPSVLSRQLIPVWLNFYLEKAKAVSDRAGPCKH